uniref:Uncharacterized protein n=1 Tax=Kalanchoe fedtschenkoi TaxID=63787 RepID=A0A7N0SWP7_KALFE
MISRQQLLRQSGTRQTGGLKVIPFVLANAALERLASNALLPNMIKYLMGGYGMELAHGTQVIFFWNCAINFMPLIGASLADSYLGRFLTIGLASIICLLGVTLLWLTAMIAQARPAACAGSRACEPPTPAQLALLFSSFTLIAVGSGSLRPCSLGFGADQLDQRSRNKYALESYFNWYYTSVAVAALISITGPVYVQDNFGWKIGFGVSVVLIFLAVLVFFVASSFYVKHSASRSVLVDFAQVIVASFRKRKLPLLLASAGDQCYHCEKGSECLAPTDKLRFLNKACVLTSNEQEVAVSHGSALDPWKICTVEQVEQLKALLKVLPVWSTGIMVWLNVSQDTFRLQQANSMDRHITSTFQIPAGSFSMFVVISVITWIVLYDRVIIPLASSFWGKPVRLGVKLRMGIGLLLSCIAMVVSVIVEHVRREKALASRRDENQVATMSAMWLIPQCAILGLSEAFNAIGQTEFYYSEMPKSMSSIAGSLCLLGASVANLLASLILSLVDHMTSRNGNISWVSSDINSGRYDSYYALLAALSFANLIYFAACSWAYGPCKADKPEMEEEEVPIVGTRRGLDEA